MYGRVGMAELVMIVLTFSIGFIIPAIALYFVVKLAIKNAIKELNRDNLL